MLRNGNFHLILSINENFEQILIIQHCIKLTRYKWLKNKLIKLYTSTAIKIYVIEKKTLHILNIITNKVRLRGFIWLYKYFELDELMN